MPSTFIALYLLDSCLLQSCSLSWCQLNEMTSAFNASVILIDESDELRQNFICFFFFSSISAVRNHESLNFWLADFSRSSGAVFSWYGCRVTDCLIRRSSFFSETNQPMEVFSQKSKQGLTNCWNYAARKDKSAVEVKALWPYPKDEHSHISFDNRQNQALISPFFVVICVLHDDCHAIAAKL